VLLIALTLGLAFAVPLILGVWSNPFKYLVPTSDSPAFERMQERARPVVTGFGTYAGRFGKRFATVVRALLLAVGTLVIWLAQRAWQTMRRGFRWLMARMRGLRAPLISAGQAITRSSSAAVRSVGSAARTAGRTIGGATRTTGRTIGGATRAGGRRAARIGRASGHRVEGLSRATGRGAGEFAGAAVHAVARGSARLLVLLKAIGLSIWTFILSVAIALVTLAEFVVTKSGEAALMSAVRVAGFRRSGVRRRPRPARFSRMPEPEVVVSRIEPEVIVAPEPEAEPELEPVPADEGVIDRIKPVLEGFSFARDDTSEPPPSRRIASSRLVLAVVVSATGFAVLVILVVRWAGATIRGIVS
jgi:hypothetical protein